jgi:hypothetical protein
MEIKNSSTQTVSWFCYNMKDAFKLIALNSGDLGAGQTYTYRPPHNLDGWYSVRFTNKGGGTELADGSLPMDGSITLNEPSTGEFTVTIS